MDIPISHPLVRDAAIPASLEEAVEAHVARYFAAHGHSLPPAGVYDRILPLIERPLLTMALNATRGNQLKAAELLGLNRNTLRKKIKQLGIRLPMSRA